VKFVAVEVVDEDGKVEAEGEIAEQLEVYW
jgi:hypothetical protein